MSEGGGGIREGRREGRREEREEREEGEDGISRMLDVCDYIVLFVMCNLWNNLWFMLQRKEEGRGR